MSATTTTLQIGELSRRTGCHIETIRYYERIGVLPRASRRGRYRCYGPPDVARLRFICRARGLGFSLDEVRELLELSKQRNRRSCDQVRDLAARHLRVVRDRIADLERLAAVLGEAVARCDSRTASRCPVIEALQTGTH